MPSSKNRIIHGQFLEHAPVAIHPVAHIRTYRLLFVVCIRSQICNQYHITEKYSFNLIYKNRNKEKNRRIGSLLTSVIHFDMIVGQWLNGASKFITVKLFCLFATYCFMLVHGLALTLPSRFWTQVFVCVYVRRFCNDVSSAEYYGMRIAVVFVWWRLPCIRFYCHQLMESV